MKQTHDEDPPPYAENACPPSYEESIQAQPLWQSNYAASTYPTAASGSACCVTHPCPGQQSGFEPQQCGCALQQGAYQPYQRSCPPPQGSYPPPQGMCPHHQGGYPPPQGICPHHHGSYPTWQGFCPPQQSIYPPQQSIYPSQQSISRPAVESLHTPVHHNNGCSIEENCYSKLKMAIVVGSIMVALWFVAMVGSSLQMDLDRFGNHTANATTASPLEM